MQLWAEASKREVSYALCNDRRTLLWFANQRAIEYHPTLARVGGLDHSTHLVLDLDPPDPDAFSMAVQVAHIVRQALADVGLEGAVKTSGAKGVHVFVPIEDGVSMEDSAAATRAIAARAEQLDPEHRHDGVHQGGSRRQDVRRLDAGRRRHGGRGLQPTHPARRTCVISRGVG